MTLAELQAENARLEAENRAVHAELAKTRELLDMAIIMASQSWQELDVAKARLAESEALPVRPPRGRRPDINKRELFRLLTRKIREYRAPTRHDLTHVMREAAIELGVTEKRIQQIVLAAMKDSGLTWR